jgi:phosphatidylserine/phosphatidylglycerophosphate/cardiolipin synthase-like enzyme
MHHKTLIVDGHTVATGSYNYSANAEFKTFENVVIYTDEALVAAYEDNFEAIWETGRGNELYDVLWREIESGTDSSFPIVFASMALDWNEVTDLKSLIRDNCDDIDSDEFREEPASHQWCER